MRCRSRFRADGYPSCGTSLREVGMKQRSFGEFDLGEGNLQAFEWCLNVVESREMHAQLAVLLGEEGSGKTHLLCAIVNRVRSGSSPTGIAYVTADNFPQEALSLIQDPSPVEQAESAIILIDHLESFEGRLGELEALIRLFLDCRHSVVVATNVHPARLRNLTPGLGQLLKDGVTIPIESPDIGRGTEASPEPTNGSPVAWEDSNEKDLDELKTILKQVYATVSPQDTQERKPNEAVRESVAGTENGDGGLRELQRQYEGVCAQLERTRGLEEELGALRDEMDMTRAENSHPVDSADALLARAENLLDEIQQSRTRIAAAHSQQRAQIDEIRELEAAIDLAGTIDAHVDNGEESHDPAILPVETPAASPEAASGRPHTSTQTGTDARDIEGLRAALNALTHERAETRQGLAALREEMTQMQLRDSQQDGRARETESKVEQLREALDEAIAERDDFRVQQEKSAEERRTLEYSAEDAWREHGKLQESLASTRAELDAEKSKAREREMELESLRVGAAEQVGAARARLDEREGELAALRDEVDDRRGTDQKTAGELDALREQLKNAAEAMARLASRLNSENLTGEGQAPSPPADEEIIEPPLEAQPQAVAEERPFYFGPQPLNAKGAAGEGGSEDSTRLDLALADEALPNGLDALRRLIEQSVERLERSAQSENAESFAPVQPARNVSKPTPFDFEELSSGADTALHHIEGLCGGTDFSMEEASPFSAQELGPLNRLIHPDDEDPSI